MAAFGAASVAAPADHEDYAMHMANLGRARLARYAAGTDPLDLTLALAGVSAAVEATPPDDPALPGRLLDLGEIHVARHGHAGAAADADRADELARQVMRAVPRGHPLRTAARDLRDRARLSRQR